VSIKINYHNHSENSGLGNKLFLNFLARSLSLQNKEPLYNWLDTRIYAQKEESHKESIKDNQNILWKYSDSNFDDCSTVVGVNSNLSDFFGNAFHQSCNTVNLISRYKDKLIRDFGEEDGLFVHIRLGDLAQGNRWGNVCDYEYYDRCISNIGSNKRYIASDSINHPFVRKIIKKFKLKPYKDSPEETIIFGSRFKNKVLSLGTFSWWIGFVGNQENIIYPNPSDYHIWHGQIFECMQEWNMVSKDH